MRQVFECTGGVRFPPFGGWLLVAALLNTSGCSPADEATSPIVIGAPLSTQYLYGWDAERGMRLAVEEINAS